MGRCRNLGLMRSFLWYAPWLSRARILFFSILNPLRVYLWGWLQRLMAWWLNVYWNGRWHCPQALSKSHVQASQMAQCWRIHLPMQKMGIFGPWSRKIPYASEQLSLCATTIEPCSRAWELQLLSPCAVTIEACAPWTLCTTLRSLHSVTRE